MSPAMLGHQRKLSSCQSQLLLEHNPHTITVRMINSTERFDFHLNDCTHDSQQDKEPNTSNAQCSDYIRVHSP